MGDDEVELSVDGKKDEPISKEDYEKSLSVLKHKLESRRRGIAEHCSRNGRVHKYDDFRKFGLSFRRWLNMALRSKTSCKRCGHTIDIEDRSVLWELKQVEKHIDEFDGRLRKND